MGFDFTGKVALVTGDTTGIGRAAALAFARGGARVVIAGRRRVEGEGVSAEIAAAGGEGLFVACDIARESDVATLIAAALDRFGRLDCAFNNAGIEGVLGKPVHEQPLDEFDALMGVNLRGLFVCMKHEIAAMLARGGGAIVNTASILGQVGFAGSAPYVASKHAIIGLTRTAALDYATSGIRVNAICPGGVETAMLDRLAQALGPADLVRQQLTALHPMARLSRPEEIAASVLYLCSDAACAITGHALAVDGGYLAR
jgi:NAD(P)-dependent dehydrogenase (short-subunit alcohol dehydrogenase family)